MTIWFPIAPGVTLPAAPAVVNGQMTVATTTPVWNETVVAQARTRTRMEVAAFPYALEQLTEVTITSNTQLYTGHVVPVSTIDLAAPTPAVEAT